MAGFRVKVSGFWRLPVVTTREPFRMNSSVKRGEGSSVQGCTGLRKF